MLNNLENFVWPSNFSCTIITENVIVPNYYSIKISIEPNAQIQNNIAIGFRKIKYFIENNLQNSVFINKNHPSVEMLKQFDTGAVYFPTEPYDFFVGSILYTKFVSITKKYFDINHITLDSLIGDNIQYSIHNSEDCGLDLTGEHWWNMDNINTGSDEQILWEELNIYDGPKFQPKIIKGGLSEG